MLIRKALIGLLALTAVAAAQAPGPLLEGDARFLGAEPGRPRHVVRNAPYSGDVITESSQTLPDGNRIHQVSTVHVARDSEGRTRSEQSLRTLGGLVPNANLPQVVFINDPVASVNFAVNPAAHTATKSPWRVAKPHRGGTGDRQAGRNVKTESLGRQTIEGVIADGVRTTQTIPAGQIGNEQPIQIVTETWYSPELQTLMLSKRSDPRVGETTTRLANVSRAEPPHTLFEVPPDFKVRETSAK